MHIVFKVFTKPRRPERLANYTTVALKSVINLEGKLKMARITLELVKKIYSLAKKEFEKEAGQKYDINRARDFLVERYAMNPSSAMDYLMAFQKMMLGECYKRSINGAATEYFLAKIHADFGQQALGLALSSVKRHVDYYEALGHGRLQIIKKIHNEYSKFV